MRIVAAAGQVIEQPAFSSTRTMPATSKAWFVSARRSVPLEVVEIIVPPARPLRKPDEPPAVREEPRLRIVLDPARRPLVPDDDPARSRRRIAGGELEDVLPPVRPVEQKDRTVGRPLDVVDVVSDDGVVERLPVPDVDPDRRLRSDVIDEDIDDGIRLPRLGIGLDIGLAVELRLVQLEEIIGDPALVEPVEGDLPASRATTTWPWSDRAPRRRPSSPSRS